MTYTIPRHQHATRDARIKAIQDTLVGKNKTEDTVYTEKDVAELIKTPVIQNIIEIDAEVLERCDISAGAEAAVAKECEQFKMRLDYLKSVLTINQMKPSPKKLKPTWTLAVLKAEMVPRQLGQTITVSTDLAAPLWTTEEQRSGDTIKIRSLFWCGLNAYTSAEDIGFFDEVCEFQKPLLVQGVPDVLPNGEQCFSIYRFCLDLDQTAALKKERKARLDLEAKEKKAAEKAAREAKRAEDKAEKARKSAEAKALREANKKTKTRKPRTRKVKATPAPAAK